MENSSLNRAHQQHRRAEAHLRHRRYDEAIECHLKAAELINEALAVTENPRSLESLKLQRDYHLRQKDIILVKKEQFENYRKAFENQRQKMLNAYCNADFDDAQENESTTLQVAIYRKMEEADSLLGLLYKKNNGGNSDSDSLKSISTTDTDDRVVIDTVDCSTSTPIGSKHPKDDSIVIEELRTLNEQLHSLVYKLVTQLDVRVREVDMLKDRIKQLESEKNNKAQTKNSNNTTNNSLKVITDSSGGTSPYVFSPCSELSPDVHETRVLPSLAPLEMPNFDFTKFVRNNSNPINAGN